MVHLDVADGHFAREVTMGQPVVASLRKATRLPLDVHLQIERPERFAREFVKCGASRVAVHAEATKELRRLLVAIRAEGALAGVALNPATSFQSVEDVMPEADFVTILAADPDEGEESSMPGAADKVRRAVRWRDERGLHFGVAVEGGIGRDTVEPLARAGADILIAGFAIFQSSDPGAEFKELARRAALARETLRA